MSKQIPIGCSRCGRTFTESEGLFTNGRNEPVCKNCIGDLECVECHKIQPGSYFVKDPSANQMICKRCYADQPMYMVIAYRNNDCISRMTGLPSEFGLRSGLIFKKTDPDNFFTIDDVTHCWIHRIETSIEVIMALILPFDKRTKDDWDWIPHTHKFTHHIRDSDMGGYIEMWDNCTICNLNSTNAPKVDIIHVDDQRKGISK